MSIKAVSNLQEEVKMKQRLISSKYLRGLREHITPLRADFCVTEFPLFFVPHSALNSYSFFICKPTRLLI